MAIVINVNGRIAHGTSATIPVLDHGFLYGEGVYEVCRTYHGQPLLFDRHMRRMRNSASMIALPVPFTDREALALPDDKIFGLPQDYGGVSIVDFSTAGAAVQAVNADLILTAS